MILEDEPYALSSLAERQRRVALLSQPHVKPLAMYLTNIRVEHPEKDVPDFDPCDGGILARALFLMEAPGRKAVGSHFVSRNNPDPTARNISGLLQEAGISRSDTLLWNIVLWYVGDGKRIRAVSSDDVRQSFPYVEDLISLLPNLEVIALVGKKAQSATSRIRQITSLPIVETHHPSARVFNVWPHKWDEVKKQFFEIAALTSRN